MPDFPQTKMRGAQPPTFRSLLLELTHLLSADPKTAERVPCLLARFALIGVDTGALSLVFLRDARSDEMVLGAAEPEGTAIPQAGPALAAIVAASGTPVRVASVREQAAVLARGGARSAFDDLQYFPSAVALPLGSKGSITGALCVFSVQEGAMPREAQDFLEALAALGGAVLQQRKRSGELQLSLAAQEALAQASASGEGISASAAAAAGFFHNPVIIEDDSFVLLAEAQPAGSSEGAQLVTPQHLLFDPLFRSAVQHSQSTGQPVRIPLRPEYGLTASRILVAVRAGPDVLGYLTVVEEREPLGEREMMALQHAASVVALELLRERAVEETKRRLRTEAFSSLLEGNADEVLQRRAALLGYDPTLKYIVLVARIEDFSGFISERKMSQAAVLALKRRLLETVQTCVSVECPGSQAINPWGDCVVALVAFHPRVMRQSARERCMALASRILEETRVRQPELAISVGLGRMCQKPAELGDSFRDAQKALHIARKVYGRGKVVDYEALGANRLLLQVDDAAELDAFVQQVLGKLFEHEGGTRGVLMETLKAYAGHNRHLSRTAEALLIHVNTLSYRLTRIQEVTELNFDSGEDWLNVQLALRIQQLRGQA